jgi:hypothetical protein
MQQKPIERIDIERVGANSLMVRKWFAGYDLHDAGSADVEDFVHNASLDRTLADYEKQGFAVWISRRGMGHAIKGPITRVDILLDDTTWTVKKYPRGWKAETKPISTSTLKTEGEVKGALQWLKENNWTVIEWEGNYRAFKGKMLPVHDAHTIRQLRRKNPNARYNLAFYY